MRMLCICSMLLVLFNIFSVCQGQEELTSKKFQKQSIEELISLLQKSDQPVKIQVLDAIGKRYRNGMPALSAVVDVLQKESSNEVKIHAAGCLINLAKYAGTNAKKELRESALPELGMQLEKSGDELLKLKCSLAIVEIAKESQPLKEVNSAVDVLAKFLEHKNSAIRFEAGGGLETAGEAARSAIPALIKVLKQDTEVKVRIQAAETLNRTFFRQPEVLQAFVDVLADDELDVTDKRSGKVSVSDYAALCIYNNHEKSIPLVEPLLKSENPGTRFRAASSLISLQALSEAQKIVEIIGVNLVSPANQLTGLSLELVTKLGPSAAALTPQLIKLLANHTIIPGHEEQDQYHTYSQMAAFALGSIGLEAKTAAPEIEKLLLANGSTKPQQSRVLYNALKNIQPDHQFQESTFILEETAELLNRHYFQQAFYHYDGNTPPKPKLWKQYQPFKLAEGTSEKIFKASSTTYQRNSENNTESKISQQEYLLQYENKTLKIREKEYDNQGKLIQERNYLLSMNGSNPQLTLIPEELASIKQGGVTQRIWTQRKGGYFQEEIKLHQVKESQFWITR